MTIAIELDDLPDLESRLQRVADMAIEIERLPDNRYVPMGSELSDIEWYSLCAVIKSGAHAQAFCRAIRERNTVAAGAMLRLQMDVAMRLNGLKYFVDIEAAGASLMAGVSYRSIPSKIGKLFDATLIEKLNADHPWVKGVYDGGNEDVHLSRTVIMRKMKRVGGMLFFNLRPTDEHVSEQDYFHLVDTFFITLRLTRDLLASFLATRPGPDERARHKAARATS
ncbi:MAG: hypothetical protein Devi2KO_02630 [Devosia indica]